MISNQNHHPHPVPNPYSLPSILSRHLTFPIDTHLKTSTLLPLPISSPHNTPLHQMITIHLHSLSSFPQIHTHLTSILPPQQEHTITKSPQFPSLFNSVCCSNSCHTMGSICSKGSYEKMAGKKNKKKATENPADLDTTMRDGATPLSHPNTKITVATKTATALIGP